MRTNGKTATDHSAKLVTPDEAVAGIKRGQRVFIGSGAAEPQTLVNALAERGDHLADNQLIHIRSLGVAPYAESRFSERFRYNTLIERRVGNDPSGFGR